MILEAHDIFKSFEGTPPQEVLRGVSLSAKPGESIAIMGKSGGGKSTLLHILGTLDAPSSGTLNICGEKITGTQKSSLRNQKIGFIFQFYNLLEDFTVWENVLMPARIGRHLDSAAKQRARELLSDVDLSHKASSLAKYLSGGEKQRVAIARALLNKPALLLADEPTGNLDEHYSSDIQKLLLSSAKKHNLALITVTHDEQFATHCDRLLFLKEGKIYTPQQ